MLILTNFQRFPEAWRSSTGQTGQALMLRTAWEFFRHSREADLVIINVDIQLAMKLAVLYLLFPFRRRPILANDVLLRTPATLDVAGLPADFAATWAENHALYPRGIDLLLTAGPALVALPRSVSVERA